MVSIHQLWLLLASSLRVPELPSTLGTWCRVTCLVLHVRVSGLQSCINICGGGWRECSGGMRVGGWTDGRCSPPPDVYYMWFLER